MIMYEKIYSFLKNEKEPISTKEIAEKIGITSGKATLGLLRLQEEGKIEGVEINSKLHWKIKEIDKKREKLEKKMR
ncbi:ArsR family transcriptional regulator [Thermococci archaeon]|nr:MAG: ArsR family transcriptional regulator [Thermococci archaeon]RLF96254.1 MAG: ArsR family transcriptional regulator [Thermococci archaeon]RLG02096.1 MAG: ArsR family transcriptional regulator [Thermococci archaeon]HEC95876.1 HTH domain-containing protein [Euryarchaeota archaeon]